MPIFRVSAPALLNFDVRADTREAALAAAAEVLERLDDGTEVENVDPEEQLVDACVYPTGAAATLIDEREEEPWE